MKRKWFFGVTFCTAIATGSSILAVDTIAIGRQLFTQQFAPRDPGAANANGVGDGLGPVFNESSCVACHNQGGVGGSGDASKNARSLGLESVEIAQRGAPIQADQLGAYLASIAPVFVAPDGSVASAFPMHRRGGSNAFQQARDSSMKRINPNWDNDAAASPDQVHLEKMSTELVNTADTAVVRLRVFARNTTPLFGSGLIQQIPGETILEQAQRQRRHPEISGRISTLSDGRIGRFGWRANFASLVEFNENACSAELGLQSRRVAQPVDLLNRNYQNVEHDIEDEQIEALHQFVAALPRPIQAEPKSSLHREHILLGQQRFGAIGCADCHVPHMAMVRGLYSDLLLHDMGPRSYDNAAAPPYIKKQSVETVLVATTTGALNSQGQTYYGHTSRMTMALPSSDQIVIDSVPRTISGGTRYPKSAVFRPAPLSEPTTFQAVGEQVTTIERFENAEGSANRRMGRRNDYQTMVVSTHEPTFVHQEWRTPPLWGLRDSAPYMHDGSAATVLEAIAMHGGEASGSRDRYLSLSFDDQQAMLAFLDTLIAPTNGVIPLPKPFFADDLASR